MTSKKLEVSALLDCYGGLLTQKQQRLVEYYYNEDLSLSEIAEHEGTSRQGVRDVITRAEKQLKDFESKLGFCDQFKEIDQSFEDVLTLSNEIKTTNNQKLIDKIITICENNFKARE